jgi:apolipoprotein D and lipocalin family protein
LKNDFEENFIMKHRMFYMATISLLLSFVTSGCFTPERLSTESIPAIKNFDVNRYLGTWYEIARLPHSFEKDLDSVTATYSLQDNGMVRVLNEGFSSSKGEWKEAIGKAYIPDTLAGALLKVSFFWIFYGEYKIIVLDTLNYSYAMVTSSSKNYLWILSRTPQIKDSLYSDLIQRAAEWRFPVSEIYKVSQR